VIWNLAKRKKTRTLKGHKSWVTCLAFSSDGQLLASASNDQTIRVWQYPSDDEPRVLEGSWPTTAYLAFLPDKSGMISFHLIEEEGVVRWWSLDPNAACKEWKPTRGILTAAAVSSDGQYLATGDLDGKVSLWNLADIHAASSATASPAGKKSTSLGDYFPGLSE
jgi:WD40 repeat protein